MKRLTSVFAAIALASAASAQTPTGPFTGTSSDSFETQTAFSFDPCVVERVFGGNADICSSAAHITGGWSFNCQIGPHSGGRLYGSAGDTSVITFDAPPSRFGGYFGMHHPGAGDVNVTFLAGGVVVSGPTAFTLPADCTWNWLGWDLTGGIDEIRIASNYSSGGFVLFDSLEADLGSGGCTTTNYCTAKVNSLGCTPSISTDAGCPSPGTPFMINVDNVLNNKAGIIFYGNAPNGLPFQGGFLCVNPPISRTAVQGSGGNPPPNDCSGTMSIDFDALGLGAGPWYFQGWSRDPASPSTTSLTDGVMIP